MLNGTENLLLASLDSGLGDLASLVGLDDGLDDTDSDGLSHVTDGETTKWWILSESLNTHWLGWNHLDDSSITGLDELWCGFDGLTSTTIDLLNELSELASNVSSVAIEDWSVSVSDLSRVVHENDLGVEGLSTLWWVVLGVTGNVTTADFLDGNVLDVEADVVSWETLSELLVMLEKMLVKVQSVKSRKVTYHLDGLDFSGDTSWGEGDNHSWLDDTGLNTSDWNSANTTDLVNILEWETEWLLSWSAWWLNGINGLEKGLSGGLASLGLLLPSLVPWAVGGSLNHVVTVESGDWNEWNRLGVESDLLDEV